MSSEHILLILRLVGAVALLLFMALIAWLIYRDIQLTAAGEGDSERFLGELLVVGSSSSPIPEGSLFKLVPVTSIGRAQSNTIVIDDDFVSNQHVLFSLRGSQWWVEDLGSRNGTSLNDHPLESPTIISKGDIIAIGQTRFKLEL